LQGGGGPNTERERGGINEHRGGDNPAQSTERKESGKGGKKKNPETRDDGLAGTHARTKGSRYLQKGSDKEKKKKGRGGNYTNMGKKSPVYP